MNRRGDFCVICMNRKCSIPVRIEGLLIGFGFGFAAGVAIVVALSA